MNVILRGETKSILESMVNLGYANTQSEAIRLAILWFGKEQLSEDELVAKKMLQIHKEIKEGKMKTYSLEETIKNYPEFAKLA